MKRILPLLLLTVMLRVWWHDNKFAGFDQKAGNGIMLGIDGNVYTVRMDDGRVTGVHLWYVDKTKWVEVKAEK